MVRQSFCKHVPFQIFRRALAQSPFQLGRLVRSQDKSRECYSETLTVAHLASFLRQAMITRCQYTPAVSKFP